MGTENVIILGSGCAGLTAALYTARASLNPLVIDGSMPGGLLTTTTTVENFPGFPDGIDGYQLTANIRAQAEKFGARYEGDTISQVELNGAVKKLYGESGKVYETKTLIVATGASPKLLKVPGEKEFYTKGVHTCATCDGAFYKGKEIVVLGGGDSACEEAHFLTHFAIKVTLIHRRDTLRASKVMADRVLNHPKISVIWDSGVEAFLGDEKGSGKLTGLKLKNLKTGATSELAAQGAFIAIGHVPQTGFLKGALPMDDEGYILPEGHGLVRTKVAGVFVAGDCSDRTYRQAITAAGMGAMAALEAQKYLEA